MRCYPSNKLSNEVARVMKRANTQFSEYITLLSNEFDLQASMLRPWDQLNQGFSQYDPETHPLTQELLQCPTSLPSYMTRML